MPTSRPPSPTTRSPTCSCSTGTAALTAHWSAGLTGSAYPASSQDDEVKPPQSYASGPVAPGTYGLPSCDSALLTAATVSEETTVTGLLPLTAHAKPGIGPPLAARPGGKPAGMVSGSASSAADGGTMPAEASADR